MANYVAAAQGLIDLYYRRADEAAGQLQAYKALLEAQTSGVTLGISLSDAQKVALNNQVANTEKAIKVEIAQAGDDALIALLKGD